MAEIGWVSKGAERGAGDSFTTDRGGSGDADPVYHKRQRALCDALEAVREDSAIAARGGEAADGRSGAAVSSLQGLVGGESVPRSRRSWSLIGAGSRELASSSWRSGAGKSWLNSRARASERCSVRKRAARISLRRDHFACCATACTRAALATGRSTEWMTRASVRREFSRAVRITRVSRAAVLASMIVSATILPSILLRSTVSTS